MSINSHEVKRVVVFFCVSVAIAVLTFVAIAWSRSRKNVETTAQTATASDTSHNDSAPQPAPSPKAVPVERPAAVPEPKSVELEAAVKPAEPAKPKLASYMPLDLAGAFNATVGEKWKRADAGSDDGIPGDGRVIVPGVLPRAYFQFVQPDAPNAIGIDRAAIVVSIPPEERGAYERLAVLHGSAKRDGIVRVTLHYGTGEDGVEELRVRDWSRRDEAGAFRNAKALQAGSVQLYSQTLKLDPARTLESITLAAAPGGNAAPYVFGMTAIVLPLRPYSDGTAE